MVLFLMLIQIGLLLYIFAQLVMSFRRNKHSRFRQNQYLICQIVLSVIMLLCFYFHFSLGSPFENEKFFMAYLTISLTGLMGYWINKAFIYKVINKGIRLTAPFVGVLFWISLLTTVKFFPVMILSLFPIYGFLIIAPLFVLIMSASEMIHIGRSGGHFSFPKIFFQGFLVLFLYQLALNFFTNSNWELVKIFNPSNHAFYF